MLAKLVRICLSKDLNLKLHKATQPFQNLCGNNKEGKNVVVVRQLIIYTADHSRHSGGMFNCSHTNLRFRKQWGIQSLQRHGHLYSIGDRPSMHCAGLGRRTPCFWRCSRRHASMQRCSSCTVVQSIQYCHLFPSFYRFSRPSCCLYSWICFPLPK